MKKNTIAIIFLILILIVVTVIALLFFTKNESISNIKYLRLSTFDGWGGGNTYTIKCSKKCVATLSNDLYGKSTSYDVSISSSDVNKLVNDLNKYNISSWDGFNKSDDGVLDGSSFSFELTTLDGKNITAHGYMKYPKNYREVEEIIENYFSKLKFSTDKNYTIFKTKTSQYFEKEQYNEEGYIIDSQKELELFNKKFNNSIKLDDISFSENTVFIKMKSVGSGSIYMDFKSAKIVDGELVFDIEEQFPEGGIGTDDMAFWYFVAVIPNDDASLIHLNNIIKPSEENK